MPTEVFKRSELGNDPATTEEHRDRAQAAKDIDEALSKVVPPGFRLVLVLKGPKLESYSVVSNAIDIMGGARSLDPRLAGALRSLLESLAEKPGRPKA